MIYLTGDTHIPLDIHKLNMEHFPEQKALTRKDYVIVLGDFGLLWHRDKKYAYWLQWLEEKSFTLLWIDGNHENHDWIQSLPVGHWHGGKIHRVGENIIHLMRGQVFSIEGKNFFTMGGAQSVDKSYRVEGESWWVREVPSEVDAFEAIDNLQEVHSRGETIDYVLTHTCPSFLISILFSVQEQDDPTTKLLDVIHQELIKEFRGWYFGHWHEDIDLDKYHCLYERVVTLA